jgi:hypothetical protein
MCDFTVDGTGDPMFKGIHSAHAKERAPGQPILDQTHQGGKVQHRTDTQYHLSCLAGLRIRAASDKISINIARFDSASSGLSMPH